MTNRAESESQKAVSLTVASMLQNQRLQDKRIQRQVRQMQNSVVCALSMLLDLKDLRTGVHATRLAEWGVRVGEHLGLSREDLRDVENASLLHDIGKVGVPEEILNKRAPLTRDEYDLVKKHSEYGWAILRNIPYLENSSLLVLHHHERWDGKGYPGALRGEEIPLGARIVAVVDAFDAMLSTRCYREGLEMEEVLRRLRGAAGTQFDPQIVELFIRLSSEFDEIAGTASAAA